MSNLVLLAALLFWITPAAEAQQPGRTARIGVLLFNTPESHPDLLAFRESLRQRGYVEGQNIVLEYRSAESNERLPALAAELVKRRPDAIVVPSYTPAMRAAKEATRTIPIVVITAGDPVGSGLVASLAQPGGNVTGLTVMSPELAGKRLELLKEILPRLVRVAVLWNPANPPKVVEWKETQVAATRLGLKLQSLEVRRPSDFDGAFAIAQKERAEALIMLADPLITSNRKRIVDFASRSRLPSTYTFRDSIDAGGLVAYGPSRTDLFRRAAAYVDKVLKGAKPADLPVEQPTKFDLVINLKTAKALGLNIPASLLLRADHVIE